MRHRMRRTGRLLAAALLFGLLNAGPVTAQEQMVTPNYVGVDIRSIIQAVSAVTGRNFIVDPRVRQEVTMISSTPMSPEAFYEAFLSILAVHGYAAVPTGEVIKIIPDASVRQFPTATTSEAADDIITRVVKVENVGAAQLVPILRPLIPQYGHLAAHPGSNMLIISDRASNVARMVSIIQRIDQANDDDIELVTLENASASEVVRVLTSLVQAPRADGAPVTTQLVADSRTNSVLIGGERADRLRLRALIAFLDTPLEEGGDTQVRYLRWSDAEELAGKLQQYFTAQQQQAAAAAGGAAPAPGGEDAANVNVWADSQTNALIVTAPPKLMRSAMQIVDKLDIRRSQVKVEAIIVEVNADRTAELGVTWAVVDEGGNNPLGATNFPSFGSGIIQLAGSAAGGDTALNPANVFGPGITVGVGRIEEGGLSFAAIARALQSDADTNIISTPSIVTLDNEEASISVGQEVPFVTGSFTNTGATGGGAVNPFQSIQREQIGTKLTVTPQINEGDSLLLTLSQEVSSIAASVEGAADLITSERTIETTVIVDDGDIIVLGGLIEDSLRETDQRVPILGSIPLLGNLFRARTTDKVKTNLLVFIRPTIIRDAESAAIETSSKYNYIRQLQQPDNNLLESEISLMPGTPRPVLPPIEELRSPQPGEDPDAVEFEQ